MKNDAGRRAFWIVATTVVLAVSVVGGCRSDTTRLVTPPVVPAPAPPASMTVLSGDGQVGVVGEVLPIPITIVVRDASGGAVPNLRLSLTRVDPAGIRSYPGFDSAPVTNAIGLMSVVVTLDTASGPMVFEVTVPGASIRARFSATAVIGPPARLAPPDTFTKAGITGASVSPLKFFLRDRFSNPITGAKVSFTGTEGTTVVGAEQVTDSTGAAQPSKWTLGPDLDKTYTLTATSGTVSGKITVLTTTGPPATMAIIRGNGQQTGIGMTPSIAPTVQVLDANGRSINAVLVTWSDPSTGNTLCTSTTSSSNQAQLQCEWRMPSRPGTYLLNATAGDTHATFTAEAVAPPATLEFIGDPAPNAVFAAGTSPADDVTVRVRMPNDLPAVGYRVVFNQLSARFEARTFTTDASGIAGARWALTGEVGQDSIVAALVAFPAMSTSLLVNVTGRIAFSGIAAGGAHSCGITNTNAYTVFCWGADADGQLGDGTSVSRRLTPAKARIDVGGGFNDLDGVTAGQHHTCVTRRNLIASRISYFRPIAFCWGSNTDGQAGLRGARGLVPDSIGIDAFGLSAGASHSCGLTVLSTESNKQYGAACWGDNRFGALGDGTTLSRSAPASIDTSAIGPRIASIAAGDGYSCAIASSGKAFCWGRNDVGQLGDGSTTNRTKPVAVAGGLTFTAPIVAGDAHVCARTIDGLMYCWGRNNSGQLGDVTTTDRSTPVMVAGGLLFAAVTAGGSHSCGLTANSTAYCWGSNSDGQLGLGSVVAQVSSPQRVVGGVSFDLIAAGRAHTCAVHRFSMPASPIAAYCWGLNSDGQLGDGTTISRNAPTPIADYRP